MAFQEYESDQSIHSMTTRQLRLYISDMATEAQERLDSLDKGTADRALRESISSITNRSGKVMRSTSNMDKAQMREFAYALRTFNTMDTDSGFAHKTDWQKNKARYEKFVLNRIAEGDLYWDQFITPKGNISKKGYEDYKEFIGFMKEIESVKYQFTYKTIKQYGVNQMMSGEESKARLKAMSKLLNKVYTESKGKGYTTSQLIDRFNLEWDDYVETHDFTQEKPKVKATKYKPKKARKPASSSNIKAKQGRKMKTYGSVRK